MIPCLKNKLTKRKENGNLRELSRSQSLIDFSSCDYLGLARSQKLAAMLDQEIQLHRSKQPLLGSTGSRLLTGNSSYAEELEAHIAAFHGYESGTLFNCGYMANIGLLTTLLDAESSVFFDSAIHASSRDGIRLSRAPAFPFKHNDVDHLEKRLKNSLISKTRIICLESIYSTDGSKAPLTEICRLAEIYDAHILLDEAHATGIIGPEGKGLAAELGLVPKIFAQVTTFGKALGTHGAIVMGCCTLKQALMNFANSFIYTIAQPFHSLALIKNAYELFPKMDEERSHLNDLIRFFKEHSPSSSGTHIQPHYVQGNENAKQLSEKLSSQGFDVRPLLSPTVRNGGELLRICLHAFNKKEDLATLLYHLNLD